MIKKKIFISYEKGRITKNDESTGWHFAAGMMFSEDLFATRNGFQMSCGASMPERSCYLKAGNNHCFKENLIIYLLIFFFKCHFFHSSPVSIPKGQSFFSHSGSDDRRALLRGHSRSSDSLDSVNSQVSLTKGESECSCSGGWTDQRHIHARWMG